MTAITRYSDTLLANKESISRKEILFSFVRNEDGNRHAILLNSHPMHGIVPNKLGDPHGSLHSQTSSVAAFTALACMLISILSFVLPPLLGDKLPFVRCSHCGVYHNLFLNISAVLTGSASLVSFAIAVVYHRKNKNHLNEELNEQRTQEYLRDILTQARGLKDAPNELHITAKRAEYIFDTLNDS